MATAVAVALPSTILMKSYYHSEKGHAYYKSDNSVVVGEQNALSTVVKIAVERAASDSRYVHLRFVYSNGYWARDAGSNSIKAASKQPVEDTTDPSCTLFQPVVVAGALQTLYLVHVQSGGRVQMNNDTGDLYVDANAGPEDGYWTYVDSGSLVKLPQHVAFKGHNGKYLKAIWFHDSRLLQFSSDDPKDQRSGYQIAQRNDGNLQITSDFFGKLWFASEGWVYGGWSDDKDVESTYFTPVQIDSTTIALRSNGPYMPNNFCQRLSDEYYTDCLAPATPTITDEATFLVQELVLTRTISNAVYDMDKARIYDQTPFVAGTTQLTNYGDQEASMGVEITYTDEKSYTFSRSLSLTAGVTTTFDVGVPLIAEGGISISFEINTTLQWDTATTTSTSVTANGSVPVPARTIATIQYVGTTGKCDVPYSYLQEDIRSTDGSHVQTEQTDGIYTGVSSYNFSFVVSATTPLTAA